MAEYKDIHGTTIRNSAGNLAGAKTGELFFDSTNLDFKYQFPNVTSAGSWATGAAVNTGRIDAAGAGTSTSSLFFSGAPYPVSAYTESWNGTSWTEVADLNQGRATGSGAGVSNTSALSYAGFKDPPSSPVSETESILLYTCSSYSGLSYMIVS